MKSYTSIEEKFMNLIFDTEPTIHPNALKHLSKQEVLDAWYSVVESYERQCAQEPTRWLSIGFCTRGAVELISVENGSNYLIIHAMCPVQKIFQEEIKQIKRRKS